MIGYLYLMNSSNRLMQRMRNYVKQWYRRIRVTDRNSNPMEIRIIRVRLYLGTTTRIYDLINNKLNTLLKIQILLTFILIISKLKLNENNPKPYSVFLRAIQQPSNWVYGEDRRIRWKNTKSKAMCPL